MSNWHSQVWWALMWFRSSAWSRNHAERVVWNASLAELESEDLAGFATAFSLAPTYLCNEYASYATEVAYILGI